MFKGLLAALFLIILGFLGWKFQQILSTQSSSSKIGFYDQKNLWASVPIFQKPKKDLEAVLKKLQEDYRELEKSLREESQTLQKERIALNAHRDEKHDNKAQMKDLENRWNAFHKKLMHIQKTVEDKKRCIGEAYEKSRQNLQERLENTIQHVAKARGFSVVLPKSNLSFGDPSLDLTTVLIEELKGSQMKISLDLRACNL